MITTAESRVLTIMLTSILEKIEDLFGEVDIVMNDPDGLIESFNITDTKFDRSFVLMIDNENMTLSFIKSETYVDIFNLSEPGLKAAIKFVRSKLRANLSDNSTEHTIFHEDLI